MENAGLKLSDQIAGLEKQHDRGLKAAGCMVCRFPSLPAAAATTSQFAHLISPSQPASVQLSDKTTA